MKLHLLFTLVVSVLVSPAFAMFMRPQPVPVERLLKNAGTYLAAHPDSAEATYLVARIHYLAFARNSASIPATREADDQGKPVIPGNWMLGPKPAGQADGLEEKELADHATAALTGFRDLLKKEPANSLYQLGLASLLEQISEWKDRDKPAGLPAALKAVERAQARDAYLAAYRAAYAKDSALDRRPVSGLGSLVSYEAGQAFVRLAAADANPTAEITTALNDVKEGLKKIEAIPRGAITPIVFTLHTVAGADDLLAPETVVDFNLRGYGPAVRTSWLKPATALLVWDPEQRGDITSGQQLFGGYTFQLFHATGYDALALLDDNSDGVLTGTELTGIRAWFDTNSDGISLPGEVCDLADLGIAGIAVRATGQDGPHPTNGRGLLLGDGTTLPTWDWMAEAVPQEKR